MQNQKDKSLIRLITAIGFTIVLSFQWTVISLYWLNSLFYYQSSMIEVIVGGKQVSSVVLIAPAVSLLIIVLIVRLVVFLAARKSKLSDVQNAQISTAFLFAYGGVFVSLIASVPFYIFGLDAEIVSTMYKAVNSLFVYCLYIAGVTVYLMTQKKAKSE